MALAHDHKPAGAVKESELLKIKMAQPSLKEVLIPFNSTYSVALVAKGILSGTIAENNNDLNLAIAFFKQAVKDEDNLIYNEPRDWLLPARHYLGNALIKAKKYQEAIAVFKQDLQINSNNGWALTGLLTCYRELNNSAAFAAVEKRLKDAWSIKDSPIEAAVF
jgi:tetratricopeptide (TPR) repeat protein